MTTHPQAVSEPCQASRGDGECFWKKCPQLRDGEPHKTGRHCPLDVPPQSDAVQAVRNEGVSAKIGQGSKPDVSKVRAVQSAEPFSANEQVAQLIGVLREIERYHVELVSKRKRRNDPEKCWTVRVVRQAIAEVSGCRCTLVLSHAPQEGR